ncbi:MAG: Crp/Fnr family transcriptional regulator [Bacteroidales bacterium]|jgi:CRP-like cAMP-binding protein|nr:Crp/Fnr family transcriptional regulator [Bacteroidales bacterium]
MSKDKKGDLFDLLFPDKDIISKAEIDRIRAGCEIVQFQKKDIIFKQNTLTSHIMFIKSGLVKIFKQGKNNKSIILKIATPGNFLGLISIFGESTFQYSASAIEDAEILFIDFNTFQSILTNNGKYTTSLLKKLSKENLYVIDRLIAQYHKQLPGKIADLILYFSEEIYHSEKFELPLTRNELAEFAGTTKESLIRTLTEFKNDKIIELEGKKVNIRSMDIIKTLSRIG